MILSEKPAKQGQYALAEPFKLLGTHGRCGDCWGPKAVGFVPIGMVLLDLALFLA